MLRQKVTITGYLLFACSLCALAASASPQIPQKLDAADLLRADTQWRVESAEAWLRSDDPVRVAWGAWLARRDNDRNLIPLLLKRVEEYQPVSPSSSEPADRERHDALLAVVDAIIGLHAPVPVIEARKLYPEFPAQSVILLVRSREDAQLTLLEIFDRTPANWTWLATGNVLLKQRTPGFVVRLLSKFTQHVTVSVVDSGVGGGYGGGGSECGFSLRAPKQGWPPVGLYTLTQFPERIPAFEPTFLVGGETPVYYLRAEPGNYDNPPDVPGSCDDGNRDVYRAQFLKALTQPSYPPMAIDPYPSVTVGWMNESDYKRQLLELVEQRRADFQHVVGRLRESGTLARAEAADMEPRIEIVIRDDRTDRSVPLPRVLGSEGAVAVRPEFLRPIR